MGGAKPAGQRSGAMRLLLLGKPGSGKGTQAKRLGVVEGIPTISTGDLIRSAIAEGTDLGKRFQSFTDRGRLVPDELVLQMVEERLERADCRGGFLLDGFPRTLPQALALEVWLSERAQPIFAALYIVVPDEELVTRATGRRFCPNCGTTFHVKFAPPKKDGICDNCEHKPLEQRSDDREEVVRARLVEYQTKTAPLVDFYRSRDLLLQVDGMGAPDAVESRIESALHEGAGQGASR